MSDSKAIYSRTASVIGRFATMRIWCIANFTERKCWRVNYDNEPRFTRLMGKSEAKSLAQCFEAKAWIDYEHCRQSN